MGHASCPSPSLGRLALPVLQGALGKLFNRLLAEAFSTWVYKTRAARQLANKFEHAVRFFRNMALGRAWNSWRELVQEKEEVGERLGSLALTHPAGASPHPCTPHPPTS